MKVCKKFIIIVIMFIFEGCYYNSPEALSLGKKDDFSIYTYNKSFNIVEKKIEEYMLKCHNRNEEIVTTSINGSVTNISRLQPSDYIKKTKGNSTQFFIHIDNKLYTFGAEIFFIKENITNLKVYANNNIWFANSYKIDEYIKTSTLECSKL